MQDFTHTWQSQPQKNNEDRGREPNSTAALASQHVADHSLSFYYNYCFMTFGWGLLLRPTAESCSRIWLPSLRHHAAEKPKSTAIPLVFKTKYNPHFAGKYIGQALLKHWNIIEKNIRLKMIFPKPPIIAYSRSENLRDSLVKAKLPTREKNDYTYLVRNKEDPPSSPTLHTLQDLDLGSRVFNLFIDLVEIEEGQNTQGCNPSNRRQGHSSRPFRVHTHGKTYQTNMDGNLCPKTL